MLLSEWFGHTFSVFLFKCASLYTNGRGTFRQSVSDLATIHGVFFRGGISWYIADFSETVSSDLKELQFENGYLFSFSNTAVSVSFTSGDCCRGVKNGMRNRERFKLFNNSVV